MIDALFGSKTRVKLLHLFLSNTGKSFYVREITRLIDEQINSVRRELSNMLKVGIITSVSADNKLYYEVNQHYEHYDALKQIFCKKDTFDQEPQGESARYKKLASDLERLGGIRVVVAAGVLVSGSATEVDLLMVGTAPQQKIDSFVAAVEKQEGKEVAYTVLPYEEFYYRLSVRDRFVSRILSGKHEIVYDPDKIIQ